MHKQDHHFPYISDIYCAENDGWSRTVKVIIWALRQEVIKQGERFCTKAGIKNLPWLPKVFREWASSVCLIRCFYSSQNHDRSVRRKETSHVNYKPCQRSVWGAVKSPKWKVKNKWLWPPSFHWAVISGWYSVLFWVTWIPWGAGDFLMQTRGCKTQDKEMEIDRPPTKSSTHWVET